MSGFSVGAGYSGEAVAFFNRLATAPTEARAKQLDILFRSLVSSGVWPLLDALWVLAAADGPTALANLKSVSHGLTAVNSPAFIADRGYTSDGSTSLLTGPNLSTFGGQYTLNNAHMSVFTGTDTANNAAGDIGITTAYLRSKSTSAIAQANANGGSASNGATVTTAVGHLLWSRVASDAYRIDKNGVTLASPAVASTSIQSAALKICGTQNSSYSLRQISAASVGGPLTATQSGALYNALATYLQSVGAPIA